MQPLHLPPPAPVAGVAPAVPPPATPPVLPVPTPRNLNRHFRAKGHRLCTRQAGRACGNLTVAERVLLQDLQSRDQHLLQIVLKEEGSMLTLQTSCNDGNSDYRVVKLEIHLTKFFDCADKFLSYLFRGDPHEKNEGPRLRRQTNDVGEYLEIIPVVDQRMNIVNSIRRSIVSQEWRIYRFPDRLEPEDVPHPSTDWEEQHVMLPTTDQLNIPMPVKTVTRKPTLNNRERQFFKSLSRMQPKILAIGLQPSNARIVMACLVNDGMIGCRGAHVELETDYTFKTSTPFLGHLLHGGGEEPARMVIREDEHFGKALELLPLITSNCTIVDNNHVSILRHAFRAHIGKEGILGDDDLPPGDSSDSSEEEFKIGVPATPW